MDPKKKDPLTDNALEGRYANYFRVGHNAFEFVIDFGQFYKNDKDVRLHTRIIINPESMRNLLEVLSKSSEEYEQAFGILHKEV